MSERYKVVNSLTPTFLTITVVCVTNALFLHTRLETRKLFFCILFFCLLFSCKSKNQDLINILISIKHTDQIYRSALSDFQKDSVANFYNINNDEVDDYLWKLQDEFDKINIQIIDSIIEIYGYPGKSLVGVSLSDVGWYVIQHSNYIENFFSLIVEAGNNGELSKEKVATMHDRLLVVKGKKQLYGTQLYYNENTDSFLFFPIENIKEIEQRRTSMNFEELFSDYAKRLGIIIEINDNY